MVVEVEGTIFKTGVTKKGSNYVGILVKRPDGQADTLTVFTPRDGFKAGAVYKGRVNVFVQMANEVDVK